MNCNDFTTILESPMTHFIWYQNSVFKMHITNPTHLKVDDPLCHIYQIIFLLELSIDQLRRLVRHLLSPIRFANQCDQIRQNLAILEKKLNSLAISSGFV